MKEIMIHNCTEADFEMIYEIINDSKTPAGLSH